MVDNSTEKGGYNMVEFSTTFLVVGKFHLFGGNFTTIREQVENFSTIYKQVGKISTIWKQVETFHPFW